MQLRGVITTLTTTAAAPRSVTKTTMPMPSLNKKPPEMIVPGFFRQSGFPEDSEHGDGVGGRDERAEQEAVYEFRSERIPRRCLYTNLHLLRGYYVLTLRIEGSPELAGELQFQVQSQPARNKGEERSDHERGYNDAHGRKGQYLPFLFQHFSEVSLYEALRLKKAESSASIPSGSC